MCQRMLLNFVMQPFIINMTLGVLRSISLMILYQHLFMDLSTSRLDYCYSLLNGLPKSQILKLQHIQNAISRLAMNIGKHSHVTPAF